MCVWEDQSDIVDNKSNVLSIEQIIKAFPSPWRGNVYLARLPSHWLIVCVCAYKLYTLCTYRYTARWRLWSWSAIPTSSSCTRSWRPSPCSTWSLSTLLRGRYLVSTSWCCWFVFLLLPREKIEKLTTYDNYYTQCIIVFGLDSVGLAMYKLVQLKKQKTPTETKPQIYIYICIYIDYG